MPRGRCRLHGGCSTGPKSREGRLKGLLNLKPFRHLKSEPPEVILAELGHLLERPVR